MLKYIFSRLLTFLPTFFGVTLIAFSFIRLLPGDPIIVMRANAGSATNAMPSWSSSSALTGR